MRYWPKLLDNRRRIESVLLVCAFVAASMAIILPLTAPKVKAQVTHLGSTSAEDGSLPYDVTGAGDFLVYWDAAEDHIMNIDYIVEPGWELRIPALNFISDPLSEHEITIQGPINITVAPGGKLTIETDGAFSPTKTYFMYPGFGMWDGIYFESGSEGVIQDVIIENAQQALVFSPGSIVGGSGIQNSRLQNYAVYGLRMDGAVGNTNIHTSVDINSGSGTNIYVSNGELTISDAMLLNHGTDLPQLHASNAEVTVSGTMFNGMSQPGYAMLIENSPAPNSTVASGCYFANGVADNYYIKCDGASPFIDNATFDEADGALTIIANENSTGVASHPILRNPNDSGSFNSSRINATDDSTVTLQWYVDVFVDDPDGNAISNSQVNVSAPSQPSTKVTDALGWAEWFTVTGFIKHNDTVDYFSPFNISAENNTMFGYAEPFINESQDVFITVPFNPIPNTLPQISPISTPAGLQTDLINIDFMIVDPDPGDIGKLWVQILFWDEIDLAWKPVTAHGTSDPTTGLSEGILYTFVWDSRDPKDFLNKYSTEVYIQINVFDNSGFNGTPVQTGNFTVDNKWPEVLSGPTVTAHDTYAIIQWTVDEPGYATVRYGLYNDGSINDLTNTENNATLTTLQYIEITGLLPGRQYTYMIQSEDVVGNQDPGTIYVFETEVYIYLYQGWNMISIPHMLFEAALHELLSTIDGEWDIAQWYDAFDTNDHWKTNHTGKPPEMNDLHQYYPFMGLWIHLKNNAILNPDQAYDNMFPGEPIPLYKGWNFVGYNSVTPRDIDAALITISGSYDKVEHYDAQSGQWLTYDGSSGTLTSMELGRGYWIHATADVELNIPYV